MRGFPTLVTLLALLASSSAGPISSLWDNDSSKCANTCTASSKFQYSPGTTYQFQYQASTSTAMEDASEDTARLSVSATALVHVISKCDMVLQLRDVTVQESDPESQRMRDAPESSRGAAILERQPLRFSFQDGVVDELCPSEQDDFWALNIKRGVLSAFQTSMKRLDSEETVTEVDVSGRCPAQYKVDSKGWYSTTLSRTKDLLACTDHSHYSSGHASSYITESPLQSLPLLKGEQQCQQTVDQNGILSSATCTETHQFRPFSREASGAVTKVTQSLKYTSRSRSSVPVQPVSKRTTLLYGHDTRAQQEEIIQKAMKEAEDVLSQLCRNSQQDVRPDTPQLFSSLVAALRKLPSAGLQTLRSQVEQNTICAANPRIRKFFMDALPMAGSEASVEMMTQMLTRGEVTGMEADMWMTSLALIQNPTPAMLDQVKQLVNSPKHMEKVLLPVSTMLYKVCQGLQDCSSLPPVQALMTSITNVIPSSCYVNKKNLDQVLMGLRAIGNAGHVTSAIQLINRCMTRSRNPMEVRVAAAQAFRRMPCEADRSEAMAILKDSGEDSELRISAYLAVMTCPDKTTLKKIERIFTKESDKQVGSFIWSHLTNLKETSNPHKQDIRQILKDMPLPSSKFDLGRLQFSRYYEGSAFMQRLNSGAEMEGQTVWSSTSSLPRSLAANVTVDLFGRSLNVVDFGLRLEGLEYLMETLLGPYGYFGGQDGRSQAKGQLDEVKGWMYMRMLGNEMTFQRFQGLSSISSPASFNLMDMLVNMGKDHKVALTKSMELLDSSVTVPTSCGLPVALTVRGAATVDLQASGSTDFRQLAKAPRTLHLDGEIRPSAAITVTGEMRVNAHVSQAALRMTGTLHSSSALKARMDLDRGRVLSMELDLPQDKMELLDIRSEFHIVHNKVEKKQAMITDNRKTWGACSGSMAARVTGLELCGQLTFPNASRLQAGPYFPLTGPSAMSLTLHKRDTLTGYKIMAKRVENKKKSMVQLSFNTPGSKVDRSLALDMMINHADQQVLFSAASPWKKAEFSGGITNTKRMMGINGKFTTDDVNVYALTTEMRMAESKSSIIYKPRVEIKNPGNDDVVLDGQISLFSKSSSVDLSVSGLSLSPWTLKSAVTNNQKEVSLTGEVTTGDKEQYSMRVGSTLSLKPNGVKMQVDPFLSVKTPKKELVSFTGSGLYSQGKILKSDMTFTLLDYKPVTSLLTMTMSGSKNSQRLSSKASIKCPLVSGSITSTVSVRKGRLVSGRATMSYSVPRSIKDRLQFNAKFSDRSTKAYNKYTLRGNMDSKNFPDINTAVKLNVDHKRKLSSGDISVQYGKDPRDKSRRLALSAELARKIKNLYNVDLTYKMAAEAPEQNVDIKVQGSHLHNSKALESSMDISLAQKKAVSVALNLGNKSGKLTKMDGQLTFKTPGNDFALNSALNQVNRKQWEHSMSMKVGPSKHSFNAVYQNRGARSHQVTSTVEMQGYDPITLSGDVDLDFNDLQLAASLQHGKNTYGVSSSQKLAKSREGKWGLEVTVPSRRMTLSANAGKVKGNFESMIEAAWNADKDPEAKLTISGMAGIKEAADFSSHKGRLTLTSPAYLLGQGEVKLSVDSSADQYKVVSHLSSEDKVMTSTLLVTAPLTMSSVDVDWKVKTPYAGYRSLGLTVNHKVEDQAVNCKLSFSKQKDQCEITLKTNSQGKWPSSDMNAQLDVRSTLGPRSLRSVSVNTELKVNGQAMDSKVNVKVNSDLYAYDLSAKQNRGSSSGLLTLTWPKDQMKTSWTMRHSASSLHSSITSSWASNSKRVQLDITGAAVSGSFSGSLALEAPKIPDWKAEMNTQYGSGRFMSFSSVKLDSREQFSYGITVTADKSKTDVEFGLTSPWTEPINSKGNAKYDSYPMSASADLSWAPSKKVTAEGSIMLNSWDDLDINMKVTTPVRSMRTLAAAITSKVEGQEVVSKVNVDMDMHQNLILTTRLQRDNSGMRVELTSPWEELRNLEAGLETSIRSPAGNVKADFKALPVIGQYQASAFWDISDDMSAKVTLNTPIEEYSSMQMVASSKYQRGIRVSHLEVELSPRQIYSLDVTNSLRIPLLIDISGTTPIRGFESLSASLRANKRDYAMDATAQITYSNEQSVKVTATMDWSRGADASLSMSTPFRGWRQTSASLRHQGPWSDFSSSADVSMGGQGVSANLRAVTEGKTDIQLVVATPWRGWEKMEASITRKGKLNNLRATANLLYGDDQKVEASLQNKWSSHGKALTLASMKSPFTNDLRIRLVHDSDNELEGSVSYGREYSLEASGKGLWTQQEISSSGKMQWKAGGPSRVVTAAVSQVGPLQDMALTASASVDQQEVSLTAQLSTLADLKASLQVKTPFAPYQSVGASLLHSGDLSNGMNTEMQAEYKTSERITIKTGIAIPDLSQINIRGSLTSDLRGLESGRMVLTHSVGPKMCKGKFSMDTVIRGFGSMDSSYQVSGKSSNLKAESRVTYNNQPMLDARLAHKLTSNRLQSSLNIMISKLPELSMDLKHNGDMGRFTTRASANLGEDKISSVTRWTMGDVNVDLSQSLTTKIQGESNQVSVVLSKVGPLSDVTLQLSGNVNAQKAKIMGKMSTAADLSASLEVESPMDGYRQMGASFLKSGHSKDMAITAAANLGRKKMELNSRYSHDNEVRGSVDITTPIKGYRQMGASFSLGEENAMISANVQNDKMEATGRFVSNEVMEGNIDITTPFNGYRQMGAAFNYGAEKAMIMGMLQNQKIEASGKYVNDDSMGGNVEIKTPFEGFKQMGASVNYDGQNVKLSGNVQDQKVEGNGRLSLSEVIEGSADVSTPFEGFRMMAVSFNKDGQNAVISASLENQNIEITGRLISDRTMEGSVDIKTPFDGYREMGASYSYDGQYAMLSGNFEGEKIEATGKYANDEAIAANAEIKTPFEGFKQMGAKLQYDGQSAKASANLQEKKIEADVKYSKELKTEVSAEIKTPFEDFKQMGVSMSYDGEVAIIAGNLENKKVEATGKFHKGDSIETSAEITTPFQGFRRLGASFDYDNKKVKALAKWDSKMIEAVGKMAYDDDITGSLDISTPFQGYRKLGGEFSFAGDKDITLMGKGHLEDKSMEAAAKFNHGQDKSGSLSLTTPFSGFRQMSAGFKHSGPLDNMNVEGHVTYMDDKTISVKSKVYSRKLRRIEASVELTTPFPGWEMSRVSYKHSGNSRQLSCSARLDSSLGQHSADLKMDWSRGQSVKLSMQTPHSGLRMTELAHDLKTSDSSLDWSGSVNYGEGKQASSHLTLSYPEGHLTSTFDLHTPYTSDITSSFDLKGTARDHTIKMSMKYGDRMSMSDEQEFRMTSRPSLLFRRVMTYTLDDVTTTSSVYLHREGPWNDITVNAKGSVNGQEVSMDTAFKKDWDIIEGSVKVNTPFQGYSSVGGSWRHSGSLRGTFISQGQVQYGHGQQVSGKLDWRRTSWKRMQAEGQVTTTLQGWEEIKASYRHSKEDDGFSCSGDLEYMNGKHLNGDLRVMSSPKPELKLTVKTPWRNWEQMSASGSYMNDGWGKKEMSGEVDLGQSYVYTAQSSMSGSWDSPSPRSFSGKLTSPHAWMPKMEVGVNHQGSWPRMSTSAFLRAPPHIRSLSTQASLRYTSPSDMQGTIALDTPFKGLKRWKMEMNNGEKGSQKTSHVIVGWSGDKEIVMDGSWKHDNSYYERHLVSGLSVSTPFEGMRRTNWEMEHHSTVGKYQQKMVGNLNGKSLVDIDLSTLTGDLPEVTVTLAQPIAMQYSAARTPKGADLYLDWDRSDPTSNVRVTSQFSDSSNARTTKHDLDVKMIHSSLTLGAKYSLQASPVSTASQGEISWGRGDRRLFYSLDLSDLSRMSVWSYEGKMKVGAMSRAVQVSGAMSRSPSSRRMDASLQWDAQRDPSQQVALMTEWRSGPKNKADITLKLPAINQEVRVQSEVAVNQGRTLLEATTALSYCPESSKVLTFTSSLHDTSAQRGKGSNYTLRLSLTHPHSDLDLALTSHLGKGPQRYSAAMDAWYLSSRGQQRHNMALRGEIDQLRRQITMEMVSPVKKVSIQGQVQSMEPYAVSLSNRLDDVTLNADVMLDTSKRFVSVKTNYDTEHPERTLVMKAQYVNDTAIKAEVYRDHVSEVITDAMMALRLNTSTLLHSHLHWRPSSLREMQDFLLSSLTSSALSFKQGAHETSAAVREELGQRWGRSVGSALRDLQPYTDLLTSQLDAAAEQMTSVRRQIIRMARKMPVMEDRLNAVQEYIGRINLSYRQSVENLKQQIREKTDALERFPIRERYQQTADSLLAGLMKLTDQWLVKMTAAVKSIDDYLMTIRDHGASMSSSMQGALNNLSQPDLLYLKNSLDISPYLQSAKDKLNAVRIPEEYTAAIYQASSHINDVMNMRYMRPFKDASNEVYQQGVWAYKYWEVEENLRRHLSSLASLIAEILEEEVDSYSPYFHFLRESHITVWDPEHGEVQADIRLPLPMKTLDSAPDVTPLLMPYNRVINSVPDMDTVQYFYENYVPGSSLWSSNEQAANASKPRSIQRRKNMRPNNAVYAA